MISNVQYQQILDIVNPLIYSKSVLADYEELQSQFAKKEIEAVEAKMHQEMIERTVAEDQVEIFNNYHEFHLDFLKGPFIDIQSKANLIIVYSIFEGSIKKLCEELHD